MTDSGPTEGSERTATLQESAPGGLTGRAQLVLLQVLVAIVLSYHVQFSHETHALFDVKEWVVLGLLLLTAVLLALPARWWETKWLVGGCVVADTLIVSGITYFSPNAANGLHVTYFLIILIAASAPTLKQVIGFSTAMCTAYGIMLLWGPLQTRELLEGELLEIPVLLIMGVFYGAAAETVREVRRRAERMLRESEVKFRSVVQSAPDAVILIDSRGTVVSWNKAAQAIFGYTEREAVGEPLTLFMPERYREAHLRGLQRFLSTGESYLLGHAVEFEGLRKDGTEFPFELSITSWSTDRGLYFSGILRDISERKRVDEWVAQKEERLHQAQKMEAIGRLASEVAHDFNHLLFIILGSSELLRRRLAPEDPSVKKLEEISKAVDRGRVMTQRLLSFGRKQPQQPVPLNLNSIVADLAPMLERLLGRGITLVTRLSASLAPVLADTSQLEQVLMNLVTNARDAMPRGGVVTIETATVDGRDVPADGPEGSGPTGPCAVLAVSDTGVGMEPEVQAHCFDYFFTTKAPDQGTGLGLAMVRSIVQQNGGLVTVRSQPGQGTTFRLYFPQAGRSPATDEPAGPPKAVPRGTETILVVDDDCDARLLMQEWLQQQGYRVLEVADGETALLLAAQQPDPIHLLVTDMAMPAMNGKELARRLSDLRAGLKVLYVSGCSEEVLASYGVTRPGDEWLAKPFTIESLAAKVREVLDRT